MAANLKKYQWQIGDLIFGPNTQYPIQGVNPASYAVNAQDYQVSRSDRTRMAQDTLQAGAITFQLGVIDNAPMPAMAHLLPDDLIIKSSKLLTALQTEWKADEIRQIWGAYKPLTFCDGYGSLRRVYGRPGKFQYSRKRKGSQFHKVTAEYRRLDTLSYSDTEYAAGVLNGVSPVNYTRLDGDGDAPIRVLLYGPQTNPVVTIGDNEIQLQVRSQGQVVTPTIAAGAAVEVCSYPWQQRIIDSNSNNGRNWLIGNTKYLDQLMIPAGSTFPVSWSASGTTAQSGCIVLWRDAFNII